MAFEGFPPFIAAQLHFLLNNYPDSLKIEQVWSGNKYHPKILDRFTLVIPYCLDTIKWDVIYNSDYPMAPPDVIFGPEDEDFHPCTAAAPEGLQATALKKVFSEWTNKEPTRLLALIQTLRDLYLEYQRKRVGEVGDDRLKFEISTIITREGLEMLTVSGAEKPAEVKFAVPLMDININKMVVGCPWKHQQKIYLQVVYPVARKYESSLSAPRLKLVSSSDLQVLFSTDDVKLPSWIDGMCLAEYIPHLEETLERQVMEAIQLIDARRHFIETLAPVFGRPLEADPVFCRKAAFLVTSGAFTFLVHIFLSTQFPKQQPALMFQSAQHIKQTGVAVKSNLISDYPWSPRWEISLMAERLYEFVVDESQNFKRYCTEASLQPY